MVLFASGSASPSYQGDGCGTLFAHILHILQLHRHSVCLLIVVLERRLVQMLRIA